MRGMHVVTLGTAGGPIWHRGDDGGHRAGIATAVVVDGAVYLVDCGHGVGQQMVRAGLDFHRIAGIFITHMHSDHTIDLNSLMVMGGLRFRGHEHLRVPVFGPGRRGSLAPVSAFADETPEAIFPDAPTPGTSDLVELLLRAHATDLNDRRRDSLAADTSKVFRGVDIEIPESVGFHPNDNNHPEMEPFEVLADDRVRVTATLVQHQPVAPAFAFRFDTSHGSVVVSGDTAVSENLVRLARDADLLLHEAIDLDHVVRGYDDSQQAAREASMDHHRKAHTPVRDAGDVARRAGVRTLALHHLVPPTAPEESWLAAGETFDGTVLVPKDLDVLDVGPAE